MTSSDVPQPHQLHRYPGLAELSTGLAERLAEYVGQCQRDRGSAHLALAGGRTPERLYRCLATSGFREAIDWGRLHIYFGDERAVPPDHPDSNYRMAREALLDQVPIPAGQIHPIAAMVSTIRQDAANYAEVLRRCAPSGPQGFPQFDLVLLGLGEDGHTASLFPKTCILRERHRPVAAVYVPRLKSWRISLTYPVLEEARALWFLVAGSGKAAIMRRVFQDPGAGYPVQGIRARGRTEWFLDAEAAAELK